jgi:antitoxin (DNA-binding transcriptional repressor) of toxin-antitoxin stability system
MATRMGIRQLRDSLPATIQRVRRGETFEVTHHGAPVAVLAPLPVDRIERLVAKGEITPGRPLERALRRYPVTGERSASQAIEDDRAER